MENKAEDIRYRKCVFKDVKENMIETDLELPDYYPDINRILSCTAEPYTEAFSTEGDRLSMEGISVMRLLYAAEDKKVYSYETELRYTKATQCAEAEVTDTLFCSQKTVSISFRAVGPRRVEVRATVAVSFSLHRLLVLPQLPAERDGIEMLHDITPCCSIHALYSDCFTLEEDFTPKDERLRSAKIIGERVRVYATEYKAVEKKILIKGYCDICFSCLDPESGTVFKDSESIPFSQILEVFGLEEGDTCLVLTEAGKYTASFRETGECVFSVRVAARILCTKEETAELTTDLFSGRKQIDAKYSDCMLCEGVQPFSETILVNKQTEAYEDATAVVEACGCSHITASAQLTNGSLMLEGNVTLFAVLQGTEGCCYVSRTAEIAFQRDVAQAETAEVLYSLSCKAVACTRGGDGLLFKAELDFSGAVLPLKQVRVVREYEAAEKPASETDESIIGIYFAETGERIWDIAKASGTSLRALREANNIETDVVEASMVLLLPDAE